MYPRNGAPTQLLRSRFQTLVVKIGKLNSENVQFICMERFFTRHCSCQFPYESCFL
jgi:hypothetical protein